MLLSLTLGMFTNCVITITLISICVCYKSNQVLQLRVVVVANEAEEEAARNIAPQR